MEFRAASYASGYEANSGFYNVVWERKRCKSPKSCDLSNHLKRYKFMNHMIYSWNIYDNTWALISGVVLLLLSSPLLFPIMNICQWVGQQHHRAIVCLGKLCFWSWIAVMWGELGKSVHHLRGKDTERDRRIRSSFFSVSKFTPVWTPGE